MIIFLGLFGWIITQIKFKHAYPGHSDITWYHVQKDSTIHKAVSTLEFVEKNLPYVKRLAVTQVYNLFFSLLSIFVI